jgi:hypothetical protein
LEDDGEWLRVADRVFLPVRLAGVTLLHPLSQSQAERARSPESQRAGGPCGIPLVGEDILMQPCTPLCRGGDCASGGSSPEATVVHSERRAVSPARGYVLSVDPKSYGRPGRFSSIPIHGRVQTRCKLLYSCSCTPELFGALGFRSCTAASLSFDRSFQRLSASHAKCHAMHFGTVFGTEHRDESAFFLATVYC